MRVWRRSVRFVSRSLGGMRALDGRAHSLDAECEIALGGLDRGVAEQLLDVAHARSPLEQVHGASVTQAMRRERAR